MENFFLIFLRDRGIGIFTIFPINALQSFLSPATKERMGWKLSLEKLIKHFSSFFFKEDVSKDKKKNLLLPSIRPTIHTYQLPRGEVKGEKIKSSHCNRYLRTETGERKKKIIAQRITDFFENELLVQGTSLKRVSVTPFKGSSSSPSRVLIILILYFFLSLLSRI